MEISKVVVIVETQKEQEIATTFLSFKPSIHMEFVWIQHGFLNVNALLDMEAECFVVVMPRGFPYLPHAIFDSYRELRQRSGKEVVLLAIGVSTVTTTSMEGFHVIPLPEPNNVDPDLFNHAVETFSTVLVPRAAREKLAALVRIDRAPWPSDSPDLQIDFAPDVSPENATAFLNALADFYRACGGVGLRVEFDLYESRVPEPEVSRV